MTQTEIEALMAYKGKGYFDINDALRRGLQLRGRLRETVHSLNRALSRFRLPEAVTAFRGLIFPHLYDNLSDIKGNVIVEHGYTSTSLLRAIAEDHMDNYGYIEMEVLT